MENIDYNQLDPGIRNIVKILRENGFKTTDSGDGSKFGTMEGAFYCPHVNIVINDKNKLMEETDRLYNILHQIDKEWIVQSAYSPNDGVCCIFCYLEKRN